MVYPISLTQLRLHNPDTLTIGNPGNAKLTNYF